MTREQLAEKLFGDEALCECCPWTRNEVEKPRIGTCEGYYCEQALDTYIDENNIILDN